nr:toxin [uncultured Corynebacterium sp.]
MRATKSATKHGISARDAFQAATDSLWVEPLDDDPEQWRELRLGFDTHARLLETVVVVSVDGEEVLIHAMKARAKYIELLR